MATTQIISATDRGLTPLPQGAGQGAVAARSITPDVAARTGPQTPANLSLSQAQQSALARTALAQEARSQWLTAAAGKGYANTRADGLADISALIQGGEGRDGLAEMFKTVLGAADGGQGAAALQAFASEVNELSAGLQDLQSGATAAMSGLAGQANAALARFAGTGGSVLSADGQATSDLADLAAILNLKVTDLPGGQTGISTGAGALLYDGQAAMLTVDDNGALVHVGPDGTKTDLTARGDVTSGSLLALQSLRDEDIPQFSAQLTVLSSVVDLLATSPSPSPSPSLSPSALTRAAIAETRFSVPAQSGMGTHAEPFAGTVEDIIDHITRTLSALATQSRLMRDGQGLVEANLRRRLGPSSEDFEGELSRLAGLQTSWQASSRLLNSSRLFQQAMELPSQAA